MNPNFAIPQYRVTDVVCLRQKDGDKKVVYSTVLEVHPWTGGVDYNFDNVYQTYPETEVFRTERELLEYEKTHK